MRLLCAALFCIGTTTAQVFVVDVNNGPGTDYTSIATAVAAVPDGAVLQVRPGTYSPFRIQNKSLSVFGTTGVIVSNSYFAYPAIEIADLASDRFVSLREVSWTGNAGPLGFALKCRNSTGTIVIERCTGSSLPASDSALIVSSCDRVFVRDSSIVHTSFVDNAISAYLSNVVMTNCNITTQQGISIRQGGGRVHLANCRIQGSSQLGLALAVMSGGELLLHGGTTLSSTVAQPAVAGIGTVTLDPSVTLQGLAIPPFDPNLTLVNRTIPPLDASTQALFGTAMATLDVPNGSIGYLCVGFAGAPSFTAGVVDPIWLAAGYALHAVGSAPAVTGGYAVPNAPWVLGIQVAWQGAVLDTATGSIAVSNPSVYVHF
ncbi:MAG: hypothetical protein IT456_04080 [Planctomycetes bacterium]|nr:hypothetical protein [Planctomycetota bacterium]